MTVPHTKGKGGLVSGIANRHSIALCPKTDRHGPVSQCSGLGYGHFCDGIDDAPRRVPEQSPVTLGDIGHVANARPNDLPPWLRATSPTSMAAITSPHETGTFENKGSAP